MPSLTEARKAALQLIAMYDHIHNRDQLPNYNAIKTIAAYLDQQVNLNVEKSKCPTGYQLAYAIPHVTYGDFVSLGWTDAEMIAYGYLIKTDANFVSMTSHKDALKPDLGNRRFMVLRDTRQSSMDRVGEVDMAELKRQITPATIPIAHAPSSGGGSSSVRGGGGGSTRCPACGWGYGVHQVGCQYA